MATNHKPRALHDWRPLFLEALADVPIVSNAARLAGIDYRQVWRVRKADPDFAEAWDEAMEQGIDKAEQEAFRRAVTGYEEPLTYQGQITWQHERNPDGSLVMVDEEYEYVGKDGKIEKGVRKTAKVLLDEHGQPVPLTVRKHSDALMALILKGRRKRVYADRTELTGADGGPVQQAQVIIATGVPHENDYSDLA